MRNEIVQIAGDNTGKSDDGKCKVFRIDDRLGSIEKGKIADLVLVKGNPLKDIRDARNIVKVMLNGSWIK